MIDVRGGNVTDDKCYERVIVVSPDIMSVGRDERVGAGQSSFKPRSQAVFTNKEITKARGSIRTSRLPKVKYKDRRSCGAFDCSLSNPDATMKGTL